MLALALLWSACLSCVFLRAHAQHVVIPFYAQARGNVSMLVEEVALTRQGESTLTLQMQYSLVGSRLPHNYATQLVPRLYTATDSVDFPAVHLLGRQPYYHEVRSGVAADTAVMEQRVREAYLPQGYAKEVAYQPWMSNAQLKFVVRSFDGCGTERGYGEQGFLLPQTEVSTPAASAGYGVINTQKTQQFQGRAYISFPIRSTVIDPQFQNNARELERIKHNLDSLLQQENVVMKRLTLKGFASPDGPYLRNVQLASGRVHSLKQYLVNTYGLESDIISVDFEPEDWEGLRQYVDSSRWSNREALLAIIDSEGDPDEKLHQIATRYPDTYRFLSDSVFIYLRHTDYRIDYVKMWEEQERIVSTQPEEGPTEEATTMNRLDEAPQPQLTDSRLRRFSPLLALKSNILFDAMLAPNVEVELPLGRKQRWSVMAETWWPWLRYDGNSQGKQNPYYRRDQRPTHNAYQIWVVGAEVRYWFLPRCNGARPWLCGTFLGLYGAGGLYDIEWDSEGDQGEFTSFGLTVGHSWAIRRHWNLEVSGGVGYVGGPRRHYQAEFQDTHLIFRHYGNVRYVGPTKLKVSLVWVLGKKSKKGGGL